MIEYGYVTAVKWHINFGPGQDCISRSSGQGQGHRSKKQVCVSYLCVVCLWLKGSLVVM